MKLHGASNQCTFAKLERAAVCELSEKSVTSGRRDKRYDA